MDRAPSAQIERERARARARASNPRGQLVFRRRRLRIAFLAGIGIAVLVGGMRPSGLVRASQATAPRRLPPPPQVAPEHIKTLRARMGRHGHTMSNLITAVVLLDRSAIQRLARNIADEEIVATTWAAESVRKRRNDRKGARPDDESIGQGRPADKTAQPGQLSLPRAFTREQEALRAAAQRLAVAALQGGDDETLADAFSYVTRTCVACHSSYLRGDFQPDRIAP